MIGRRRLRQVLACVVLAGCARGGRERGAGPPELSVVTADIQAGIEKHIDEKTRLGGGYFRFDLSGRPLALKLVRVHTEYLATLGPHRHFACVDLVDTAGDVYDMDFFLAGGRGEMTVTETTAHKVNGRPFYAWEQKEGGFWRRVPVKGAPPRLLGVLRGRDSFLFHYRVLLPEIGGAARLWLPLASSDSFQTVAVTSLNVTGRRRDLVDRDYGNRIMFLELGPEDSHRRIEIVYKVRRLEKAAYEAQDKDLSRYIKGERRVPLNNAFRSIARQVIKGKKGDLVRARALYDHVIDRMRYMKYGPGWGQGDAVYACNLGAGNCSDYHAYFIALARSIGIPARFAIGAGIPSERSEGGIDGYHCWVEFLAEGRWWPIDISEADKCSSLSAYYFGHHPANRFELSRGRDLVVEPGPASGPINFLAYPVLEIGGRPVRTEVTFSFERRT